MNVVRELWKGIGCLLLALASAPLHAQTVEYIHTDALGTPVAVTNAAGAVIERSEYEPYGALLNRPITDGPGFTGHVQDAATGLTYMQQRYYDPGIGRFLSVDPVTADASTGNNFNRYKYAANNPYVFTDPDGRLDFRKLADSFKVEVGVGLGLKATVKLGPIKGSLGVGEMMYGGGVTPVDAYGFAEVSGPSGNVQVGDFKAGYLPSRERSEMGRNDVDYAEEKTEGGFKFGFKKGEGKLQSDGSDATIGATASAVIVKVTGSIDLGQAYDAVFNDVSGNEPPPPPPEPIR